MTKQYELYLGQNDVDTAISYLVRVGGLFSARKEETQLEGVQTTRVYHRRGTQDVHLFDVVRTEGDRIKVSGPFVTRSNIKEVQEALSGK